MFKARSTGCCVRNPRHHQKMLAHAARLERFSEHHRAPHLSLFLCQQHSNAGFVHCIRSRPTALSPVGNLQGRALVRHHLPQPDVRRRRLLNPAIQVALRSSCCLDLSSRALLLVLLVPIGAFEDPGTCCSAHKWHPRSTSFLQAHSGLQFSCSIGSVLCFLRRCPSPASPRLPAPHPAAPHSAAACPQRPEESRCSRCCLRFSS